MGEWVDGWMEGWKNGGWMGGKVDGQAGCIGVQVLIHPLLEACSWQGRWDGHARDGRFV